MKLFEWMNGEREVGGRKALGTGEPMSHSSLRCCVCLTLANACRGLKQLTPSLSGLAAKAPRKASCVDYWLAAPREMPGATTAR